MRILIAAIFLAMALPAAAQSGARPRPPGAVPLDEPPPPPAMTDPALQPQVTVRTEGDQEVQEYRVKGKLYMQRVKPKNGPAYILMDHRGDGTFSKLDNTIDSQIRVPQWVLVEF
jgi:hypothetical protein